MLLCMRDGAYLVDRKFDVRRVVVRFPAPLATHGVATPLWRLDKMIAFPYHDEATSARPRAHNPEQRIERIHVVLVRIGGQLVGVIERKIKIKPQRHAQLVGKLLVVHIDLSH